MLEIEIFEVVQLPVIDMIVGVGSWSGGKKKSLDVGAIILWM